MPLSDKDWTKLNEITDEEVKLVTSITLGNLNKLQYEGPAVARMKALNLILLRTLNAIEGLYDEMFPEVKP